MVRGGTSRAVRTAVALAIALATVAAYAGVLPAQFTTFDDPAYVVENERVRGGVTLDGLLWAFRSGHAANWHPLTWISHMLDVELFGLDPRGHHATSLCLHVVNALLLLAVLARTTREFWPGALVAALFALHPTHVESVAWIAERKDVLSTAFLLLTVLAYARYVERPGRGRYVATLALFALGLMAKPMLVTLPFALLLLDVWPLTRTDATPLGRLVREKLPLIGLSLAASVTTFLVQHSGGAVMTMERLSLAARAANALASYVRYVWKTVWPTDLAAFYPHSPRPELGLAAVSLAVLAAGTWISIRQRTRRPYLAVGWLWYLGTLVPVIGLVQVGTQAMADRYTYVPSIGLYVAAVWLARDVGRPKAALAAGVAGAVLGVLGMATHRQVGYWRDTRTLFGRALAVTRDNPVAHQGYGYSLLLDGDTDAAIRHLEQALRLSPDFSDAHNNLGSALGAKGEIEKAIEHFRAALRTQPRSAETHFNLAFALGNAGRFEEAIAEYEESLRLDPVRFNTRSKLGLALAALGRFDDAAVHLREALALRPEETETRRELAVILIRSGDVEAAISEYRALLARSPNDLDALNNIAWIRATHAEAEHRDAGEAVRLAERACALATEENAILFDTLAAAYAAAGRFDAAVEACEKAIAVARAAGQAAEAARFAGHLELYRRGEPFRVR